MLLQKVPNRRNCATGIQFKEGYQSVSRSTASYRRFMDRATAQRASRQCRTVVLRQQVIIGRLESARSRRSETASIARAFLHQMERRLEMHTSLTVTGFKTNCAKRHQFMIYRPGSACCPGLDETMGTLFN